MLGSCAVLHGDQFFLNARSLQSAECHRQLAAGSSWHLAHSSATTAGAFSWTGGGREQANDVQRAAGAAYQVSHTEVAMPLPPLLNDTAFYLFMLSLSGILHHRCVGLLLSLTQLLVSLRCTTVLQVFWFFLFVFALMVQLYNSVPFPPRIGSANSLPALSR